MMARMASRFSGWPLVGWFSLLLGVLFAATLIGLGAGEAGIRAVVRRSAQTSLLFFCSAFTASSLAQLFPSAATRWMLRNRRYLGVSFAASHTYHLLALIALARVSAPFVEDLNAATIAGGGMAYVFIAAMVATSFDRTTEWLGTRRWKRLHKAGVYYVWFIFAQSYVPRAVVSPTYVPAAALLLLALGVRMAARRQQRRGTAVATPVTRRAAGG
jgi:sulfoxide reductase heme-binding subunit YedZ